MPSADRIPPLWPYLLVCAVAGVCVPFGRFERGLSADSVVMVLVSLQHWTPFYWGMDRIGMVVPLLATPIQDPLSNLLFQHAVCVFATLAAMLLLPRYLLRSASYPVVGLACGAAFLALAPLSFCFDFTANPGYGVWLAAGLGGLILAESNADRRAPWWRLLLALLLLLLAHWQYTGAALVLGPIVVLRQLLCYEDPDWRRRLLSTDCLLALVLLTAGAAAGIALMRSAAGVYPYGRTVVGSLPSADWPATWQQLAVNTWSALTPHYWPWFLVGCLAFGAIWHCVVLIRRQERVAWRPALVLFLGAAAHFFFVGTRRWTQWNDCFYRYCHPVVFLIQAGAVIFALAPLTAAWSPRVRQRFCGLLAGGLILAALTAYHPSLRAAHATLDQCMGGCTEDILAAHCTHVAGNYWNVWPAVYHANLILHDRHEHRVVWGITGRSELTRQLWQDVPLNEWRIAVPVDDGPNPEAVANYFRFPPIEQCGRYPPLPGQAERVLAYFQLPRFVVVEKRRTIWVLAPEAVASRTSR